MIGASLRRHELLDGPDAANLVRRWRFELYLQVGCRALAQGSEAADDTSTLWEQLDAMWPRSPTQPSVALRNYTAHPVVILTAGGGCSSSRAALSPVVRRSLVRRPRLS